MRLPAPIVPALLLLAACASSAPGDQIKFVPPNTIMGEEINTRIDNIPYQHREELLQNLLWLGQSGEQAIPALLKGLRHESPKVRSSCAWTLGRMGDRRVIVELQKVAKDPTETVRLEVARSLVILGDLNFCPALIEGLDSDRKEVRFLAHEALKVATGRDFGFDHLSEEEGLRQSAVFGWRKWWSEYSGDPWFAQNYAEKHGLAPKGEPAVPMGETKGDAKPQDEPPKDVPPGGSDPQAPSSAPDKTDG